MDNHYNQDNDYFNSKSNAEKYNLNNDRYTQTNDNYQRYNHNNQYNNSNEFNQPKSSVKTIINIITTIYFIASMIGIVINLGTNMPLALILFGQLFFVIGIGSFIISKNKKDDLKLLIFPFIGAIIMITSGTNLLSYQELINKLTDFAPLMIIALCFLLGLGLVLSAVISEKRAEARCQVEIEAVIIDYKRKWASSKKNSEVYCPMYEYRYEGRTYHQWYKNYNCSTEPKIGDRKTIYLNENNPTDLYVKDPYGTLFTVIGGITFMGFSLIFFISYLPTFLQTII